MSRINIGICDDEKIILMVLESMIRKWLDAKGKKSDIRIFRSGEELLLKAEELDIVFLDIEMPGIDGIETGKILQKRNPDCKIIMASGEKKRFPEVFKINAIRFVCKPFAQQEIEEALDAAEISKMGQETIELYENRVMLEVEQRGIQCITAFDSYAEFLVKNRILRKDISLNELETILDSRIFFRVHRKIIVNMLFVQEYKDGIITVGKKKIPVSRRRKKEFEQAYIECDLKYK